MGDTFQSLSDDLIAAFRVGVAEPWSEERFSEFALRVLEYQLETNPTYSRYCRKRGVTATSLGKWEGTPPVPTSAFKVVPLISGDPSRVQRVFRTSGTSRGTHARGEHHVLGLDLYKASLIPNLEAHVYGGPHQAAGRPMRLLALVPSPDEAPDSSLSFMLGETLATLSDGDGAFFVRLDSGLDVPGLRAAIDEAILEDQPVLLAGTAFAFVHWLDALAEADACLQLPSGSMILETGGFKGRSRVLSRPELYGALARAHGVPTDRIVNEYGMTELLSQFYEPVLSAPTGSLETRAHVAPPWMRTRVLDPITLEPLPSGESGLLCHYDLANAGSVMAVLTEDMGTVDEEGGLRVLGRVEGAEPRGCSLAMDELLEGERPA